MDGLRAVNVYVMETDDGLVLVDGGWAIPESRAVFESSMRQAGYALSDIRGSWSPTCTVTTTRRPTSWAARSARR